MLNVENQNNPATFLDIEVDVEGNQFKTKTYDKRDFTSSRLLTIQIYQEIYHTEKHMVYSYHKLSQVIKYVCNKADGFKETVKLFTNKLIKRIQHQSTENTMKKCLSLQHLPSTRWQNLLGSAAFYYSYWLRPRNELRLSANGGGGCCDFMLAKNDSLCFNASHRRSTGLL